ncbi:hypothetical protein BC938DRAFT_480468 [Jimgerdemannia flammicorona]|uniref:J domain-containing protein n=1 Tax=Jimgerdemannia flammicorona TaxID=994334 RepID=A0A433QIE5_9FUNG|nr:hypothetical protein BC938DRAFT_480468 [Jimgerdemannia flammicorona]
MASASSDMAPPGVTSTSITPPAATTPSADAAFDIDIDRYLTMEEKNAEVERILSTFKLDPFSILQIPAGPCTEKEVKVAYRKKSLQIHPDKVKHPRAEEAFAMLKKAETELTDAGRKRFLLGIVEEAKIDILKEKGFKGKNVSVSVPGEKKDEAVAAPPPTMATISTVEHDFLKTEEGQEAVRGMFKKIMIELELRKRKLQKKEMEMEGAIARQAEEAALERKRKQEDAKAWEDSREKRVNSWRDFQKNTTKKKKRKSEGA